jgi:hypothetical protein
VNELDERTRSFLRQLKIGDRYNFLNCATHDRPKHGLQCGEALALSF